MNNYDEKGTFKIYRSFVFRQANFPSWRTKVSIPKCDLKGRRSYSGPALRTQTMFSMLMFMCRDPGDAMSKVSCRVEPS